MDADDGVGDHRRQPARHERVLAVAPPAGHDVVAGVEGREQARDVGGVVLEVAVHGDDDLAGGVIDAGRERGGLSEVAHQAHEVHARIVAGGRDQARIGVVVAAVVDEHDLAREPQAIGGRLELGDQGLGVRGLVVDGDDDGQLRHRDRTT